MNKKIILLFLSLALGICCACQTGVNVSDDIIETPAVMDTPAPTPTPTPKPFVLIAPEGDASKAFIRGAQAQAEALGIDLEIRSVPDTLAALKQAEGYTAIIMRSDVAPELIPDVTAPLCVAFTSEVSVKDASRSYSVIQFDTSKAIETLFNAAIEYPPHDTPVRFIALFESQESPGSVYYDELFMQGMVLPKETYYGGEKNPETWLREKLDRYYDGMVDGIVAENEDLGLAALNVLEGARRGDMEVFMIGASETALSRMAHNPEIFAAAIGTDEAFAGKLAVQIASAMLNGAPPTVETLSLSVFGDFYAQEEANNELLARYSN